MQVNSCFLLPVDSLTAKICRGKWQDKYSLSANKGCLQKTKAVCARIFIAIALLFAVAIDLCVWSLKTVTIIPACRIGKNHFLNLFSLVISPLLTLVIPFGYNPKKLITQPNRQKPEADPVGLFVFQNAQDLRKQNLAFPNAFNLSDDPKKPKIVNSFASEYSIEAVNRYHVDPYIVWNLLFAGLDPDELDATGKTFLYRIVVDGFSHNLNRDGILSILKILLKPNHFENFQLKKVDLNRTFKIDYHSELHDEETLLAQLMTCPPHVYAFIIRSDNDFYIKIALELIKHGALINCLNFEQYKKSFDKLLEDLSDKHSEDLFKEIFEKYLDNENFYIRILAKTILVKLTKARAYDVRHGQGAYISDLRSTLRNIKNFISHLIANKDLFIAAQEEGNRWQANYNKARESWLPQFRAQFPQECRLSPPLLDIIGGYSDHFLFEYLQGRIELAPANANP